ncbi:hypothetical protein EYF80_060193 [Liparis tanakae]|uniref:Uncharacterized protein n=1 Tax=Liparis tanakae TaxID=230148 RepID=A0A4Z2EL25_9TELE|nr:hypothetical protein EYF80_060193 [Liparis tanakae]
MTYCTSRGIAPASGGICVRGVVAPLFRELGPMVEVQRQPLLARQVLGDPFCQSESWCFSAVVAECELLSFHQDHLKKASPRPDELHGFQRGRRQSEPPELLMYTPEKSRKSLPSLLEGNLPYRRSRRQSGRPGGP